MLLKRYSSPHLHNFFQPLSIKFIPHSPTDSILIVRWKLDSTCLDSKFHSPKTHRLFHITSDINEKKIYTQQKKKCNQFNCLKFFHLVNWTKNCLLINLLDMSLTCLVWLFKQNNTFFNALSLSKVHGMVGWL